MSIRFDNVTSGTLHQFSASAPSGSVIGLIGHGDSGIAQLLAAAPASTILCPNLAALDLPARLQWLGRPRSGAVTLVASTDPELLRNAVDEIWWLDQGQLAQRGDPGEVIAAYITSVITHLRTQPSAALHPSLRRGDGRAEILSVVALDHHNHPTALLQSGEAACLRVEVRYNAAVEDPVIGIMIRTRIGMEVYGTNTELEALKLGPVAAGDTRTVSFRFQCMLCPQSYTVTAASHDPNGVWHEWMEDAISFSVADTRYTAGVANLRAKAELS
ncbi:Wzt carbohydrate-binding domain-containing protein [Bryobacter aggregatus]|uniref:Wzt carbohydrate-binding domain-containing protein n=1 Tax=Bryobacter aggregatus TaxID=360054 RepID=UPI0004E27350|nr:Wzt carbohydrate-binding domain-containing protein [Bryobacter aggregatus]